MFDYLHPNMQGPWIFDGFSAHKCFSTSAPQVSKMNPKPGDSSVQQKSSYNPPLQTAKINELSTWSKNQRKWPDSLKLWSMFLLSMGYGVNTSTKIILWDLKVCFPSVRLLRRLDLKKKMLFVERSTSSNKLNTRSGKISWLHYNFCPSTTWMTATHSRSYQHNQMLRMRSQCFSGWLTMQDMPQGFVASSMLN